MVSTKLFLWPNPLPSILFSPPTRFLFIETKFTTAPLSLFSTAAANKSLPYGPSLLKGKIPENPKQVVQLRQGNETKTLLDESQFTRIFDIVALRVPAKDCYILESRLRGHLLNWPRVHNIARVPGDEVETQFIDLLRDDSDKNVDSVESGDELNSVLYREKLVKSFNVRGFVNFRNLARISRPSQMKRKEKKEKKGRIGKKEGVYWVEVVEEEKKDMRGLLGEEFRGGEKWKGATRLLLLDEELIHKDIEEFPEAIKVSCEFFSVFNSLQF